MKVREKISFISLIVPSYKVFICEALDKIYAGRFFVLHGQERPGATPRDITDIPIQNNINVKNRYWFFKGIAISWMPVIWWFLKNRPGTIILGDGVRILNNYVLLFISKLIGTKVLYYTHGYNHQAEFTRTSFVDTATERIRKFYFSLSDALIVYTDSNKTYLENAGVKTKIFVSRNTIDTPTLLERSAKVSAERIKNLKRNYNIQEDQRVIVYLGRMVPEKEVHLFVNLINQLNKVNNNRYFGIAIGDGSLLSELKESSTDLPIKFTGHLSGQELSDHLACSDCMFIPSHVGLAVVEAFCAGLPFVTCEGRHHSPEVDYINHETNGLILNSVEAPNMALEVAKLLEDEDALGKMSKNAFETAQTLHPDFSIDSFVAAIEYANTN